MRQNGKIPSSITLPSMCNCNISRLTPSVFLVYSTSLIFNDHGFIALVWLNTPHFFFITTCSPFGLGIDQLSIEVDDIEDFFDAWSDGQRSDLQSLE